MKSNKNANYYYYFEYRLIKKDSSSKIKFLLSFFDNSSLEFKKDF